MRTTPMQHPFSHANPPPNRGYPSNWASAGFEVRVDQSLMLTVGRKCVAPLLSPLWVKFLEIDSWWVLQSWTEYALQISRSMGWGKTTISQQFFNDV